MASGEVGVYLTLSGASMILPLRSVWKEKPVPTGESKKRQLCLRHRLKHRGSRVRFLATKYWPTSLNTPTVPGLPGPPLIHWMSGVV